MGKVVTFYSYKGGVGRSFTLANVGVILSGWGFRVLLVDWDIEAPGLNHYFRDALRDRARGVVEFLNDVRCDSAGHARSYLTRLELPVRGQLDLMLASKAESKSDYFELVQDLDWDALYTDFGLGRALEKMRAEWLRSYDFVLIDSRTGLTDFSGITTVQLPDILCFMFTANEQSLEGCCRVVQRAMHARTKLSIDRPALRAIPIPSRFEQNEEYELGKFWKNRFAKRAGPLASDWLPDSIPQAEMIDTLTIPHVPRWTFGEDLAVECEPASSNRVRSSQYPVSYAMETIAALLANNFERLNILFSTRDEYILTAQEEARNSLNPTSRQKAIFVSYNIVDSEVANLIIDHLERSGFEVLHHRNAGSFPGTSFWNRKIEEMVERADALVTIVGNVLGKNQMLESETFLRSSLRSDSRTRPIVPVVLHGADAAFLGSRFAHFNFVECGDTIPTDIEIKQVVSVLTRYLTARP